MFSKGDLWKDKKSNGIIERELNLMFSEKDEEKGSILWAQIIFSLETQKEWMNKKQVNNTIYPPQNFPYIVQKLQWTM